MGRLWAMAGPHVLVQLGLCSEWERRASRLCAGVVTGPSRGAMDSLLRASVTVITLNVSLIHIIALHVALVALIRVTALIALHVTLIHVIVIAISLFLVVVIAISLVRLVSVKLVVRTTSLIPVL